MVASTWPVVPPVAASFSFVTAAPARSVSATHPVHARSMAAPPLLALAAKLNATSASATAPSAIFPAVTALSASIELATPPGAIARLASPASTPPTRPEPGGVATVVMSPTNASSQNIVSPVLNNASSGSARMAPTPGAAAAGGADVASSRR